MAEKKKFFAVEIPLLDEKITLIANALEQLNDRTVKLDLTRILKGKSLEAIIKVQVKDGKALGEVRKILLLPFFIRRMMRKSISYVEDSFSADAEDAILRIKFFLITRKKVHRAVRNELRIQAKKWLEEYVKDKVSQDIFAEILGNRLQKTMSLKLKKIYPLALCEIRDIKIEKDKEYVKKEKPAVKKVEEPVREKMQYEEVEEAAKKKKQEEKAAEEKKEEAKIEEKKEEKAEKPAKKAKEKAE